MKEEVLVCVRVQIIEIRCDCMRDSSVNDACHMTSSSSARGWSKCLFLCVCVRQQENKLFYELHMVTVCVCACLCVRMGMGM